MDDEVVADLEIRAVHRIERLGVSAALVGVGQDARPLATLPCREPAQGGRAGYEPRPEVVAPPLDREAVERKSGRRTDGLTVVTVLALDPRPPARRYERDRPGELIHIDIKKLGRIDGICHRITGDRKGQSNRRAKGKGLGWEYLHVAVDDRSRLALTQLLPSERKEDAIAFLQSSLAWFASHGVTVERVMTDNG